MFSRAKSMSTSRFRVPIECDCGHTLFAHQGNAGTVVPCECGQSIRIPRLSRLRELSGADAFSTNPGDIIRKAVTREQSPGSAGCVSCGAQSAPLYRCFAQCESSFQKRGPGSPPGMWLLDYSSCLHFLQLQSPSNGASRKLWFVGMIFVSIFRYACATPVGRAEAVQGDRAY